MEEPSEYTFRELKATFRSLVAELRQAEKLIETEEVTENTASAHAKAVYCTLQFRRLIKSIETKVTACIEAQDWQLLTFFTCLNSDVLTKQPFRHAMLEVLKASELGIKTAMVLKSLLKDLASLAERMRHIKNLNITEAHFSTIALIKLNRLLELKNFEISHHNQYEEFGIYNKSSEKLDVRIENTPAQKSLPVTKKSQSSGVIKKSQPSAVVKKSSVVEEINKVEKFLKCLKEKLCAVEISFRIASENSLRYAHLWAEVFDEDQRSFGVESYILKCEKELRECGPFSEKLMAVAKYIDDLSGVVQGLEGKVPDGGAAEDTLKLILQQVVEASHLTLASVLNLTGQRIHDLVGEESVQRYQKAKAKDAKILLKNEPGVTRNHSTVDKGMRLVSQVAANLKTLNRKNSRGPMKKRETAGTVASQATGAGNKHEDITLEYLEAIRFTQVLMSESESLN